MKPTFNQICAGSLSAISLIGLIVVYFIPSHADDHSKTQALSSIGACLSAGIIYLMKANSDANNAEQVKQMSDNHSAQIKQMTDALANSTPVKNV